MSILENEEHMMQIMQLWKFSMPVELFAEQVQVNENMTVACRTAMLYLKHFKCLRTVLVLAGLPRYVVICLL